MVESLLSIHNQTCDESTVSTNAERCHFGVITHEHTDLERENRVCECEIENKLWFRVKQ